MSTVVGDCALWLFDVSGKAGLDLQVLDTFGAWARGYTANVHRDISVFIGITFLFVLFGNFFEKTGGGAMLPPVMGAVAFIMSDLTGLSYASIAWASLLPAVLYYMSIYVLVHNESVRNDEGRLPEDQIAGLSATLVKGWRHLLPLIALVSLLIMGYTPVAVANFAASAHGVGHQRPADPALVEPVGAAPGRRRPGRLNRRPAHRGGGARDAQPRVSNTPSLRCSGLSSAMKMNAGASPDRLRSCTGV